MRFVPQLGVEFAHWGSMFCLFADFGATFSTLKKTTKRAEYSSDLVGISLSRGSWGEGGNFKRYSEIRNVATLQKECSKEYSNTAKNAETKGF